MREFLNLKQLVIGLKKVNNVLLEFNSFKILKVLILGVAINLSLTSLGNCIAALASKATDPSIRVPYRDSTLTKLLMNALVFKIN